MSVYNIYATYLYVSMKITIPALGRIPTLPIKCPLKYIYISVIITIEYESFISATFLNHFDTKEEFFFFPEVHNQT